MSRPMMRICPECGSEMPFRLVYPWPEVDSRWECPRDGSLWDLGDGSKLVPFGSVRREPAGQPRLTEGPSDS